MDEAFLPADVGEWDESRKSVPNAIRDNDIQQWTNRILAKGASLCFIADCCHSGTMIRGTTDDVSRKVEPVDLKIPAKVMEAASQKARAHSATRGGEGTGEEKTPFELTDRGGRLVCLYAAQSHETTPESLLPEDADDRRRHGLFTYTLCQVLTEATRPLTYRELVQRVRGQYLRSNRFDPYPLVEGMDIDRHVLGDKEEPGRSKFLLGRRDGGWKITGGRLHGLTAGTVLAVYPHNSDDPLGHVKITRLRLTEAEVEPCEFGKKPARTGLETQLRAEPVHIDFGDMRLKVAAHLNAISLPFEHLGAWRIANAELAKLRAERNSLIEVVLEPSKADWLVRGQDDGVYLMPAHGVKLRNGFTDGPRFRVEGDGESGTRLRDTLARIARAQNLLSLPSHERVRHDDGIKLEVELVKYRDKDDRVGGVVDVGRVPPTFTDGDYIGFRMHNHSKTAKMYVTLLFINSGYGIKCFYPPNRSAPDPVSPKRFAQIKPQRVNTSTIGMEQVLVIAIKAENKPVYFWDLEQPTIEKALERSTRGRDNPFDTPLGRLLQNAAYARGTTRSMDAADIADYTTAMISWNVVETKK